MRATTEQQYKDYAEEMALLWDEGFELEALTYFMHDGGPVVNPYSYTQGDPAEFFGEKKMDVWKAACRADWAQYAEDATW